MPSTEQIDALYESTLKPRLAAMEGLRLQVRRYIRKTLIIIGVPAFGLLANNAIEVMLPGIPGGVVLGASFVGVFAAVLFCGFRYLIPGVTAFVNYRGRFKQDVVGEVFRIVCPTATYAPSQGIAQGVFDEPGIFSTHGTFRSDDRVRGRIGQTPFEAADADRHYSTGGKHSRTVVVFRGLFFHLDFNKRLSGTTIIQPEDASPASIGDRSGLSAVSLENPAFEAAFTVYATDQVEARYILTAAMMEQILSLRQRTGKPIFLAFKNNRAYLGVHYGSALFEPGIANTTSVQAIHDMAAHFALAEAVVHELDLNTRIWTKGVDESLLSVSPDDAGKDALDKAIAKGNVSAEELWNVAMKAVSDDDPSGAVLPPPGTSIAIEQTPGGATIRYRFSFWAWLAVGLWIASIAITAASLRVAPDVMGWREMGEAVRGRIPPVPYASELVASLPIVWLAGATVVGSISFLGWAVRVRWVAIAPDAVRIMRGVRPWPRVYPRPPYGKVVRVANAVYVGRLEGLNLVNPSASPMLKPGEAEWVAYEMRRAMGAGRSL